MIGIIKLRREEQSDQPGRSTGEAGRSLVQQDLAGCQAAEQHPRPGTYVRDKCLFCFESQKFKSSVSSPAPYFFTPLDPEKRIIYTPLPWVSNVILN